MGFQLPGAAFTPTESPVRDHLNKESLKALMRLMDAEIGIGEMLDIQNWDECNHCASSKWGINESSNSSNCYGKICWLHTDHRGL